MAFVAGPRQVGKTTTCRALSSERGFVAWDNQDDRELILAEVDRYAPPEPTAAAVSDGVAKVRARFPSAAAFDAALARSGIDERHVRETQRQELRIRAYVNQRFPAADDRPQSSMEEWVSGLRRRGVVVDLYLAGR